MSLLTVMLSILCLLFVFFLAFLGLKALRSKAVSGPESLLGETGRVTKALEPEGIVYVNREDYTARSKFDVTIEVGAKIKVVAVDGARLTVEKI